MEKTPRAKPLSRVERRAAIIDTTIPLLIEHGRAVTTKQIAEAAGVAEGTIYAVFDDKDDLIRSSVDHHLDTASMVGTLLALPTGLPLETFVERVVDITQHRVREVFALLSVLGFHSPAERGNHRPPSTEHVISALAELLTPYRAELAVSPRRAAQIIRIATFSMTLPMLTDGETFTAREIAGLLVNGITVPRPEVEAIGHPLERVAPSSSTSTPTIL